MRLPQPRHVPALRLRAHVARQCGDPVTAAEVNMAAQGVARCMGGQSDQEKIVEAATAQVVGLKLLAQEARRFAVTNMIQRNQPTFHSDTP